jgi:hypothetical protein
MYKQKTYSVIIAKAQHGLLGNPVLKVIKGALFVGIA